MREEQTLLRIKLFDRPHILFYELEVEDIHILLHAFTMRRLRDQHYSTL